MKRFEIRPEFRARFEKALGERIALDDKLHLPRQAPSEGAADELMARVPARVALLKALKPRGRPLGLAVAAAVAAAVLLYIYLQPAPRPSESVAPALSDSSARVRVIESRLKAQDAAVEAARVRRASWGRLQAGEGTAEDLRRLDEAGPRAHRSFWLEARGDAERARALAVLGSIGAADAIYRIATEDQPDALYALVTMRPEQSADAIHRALKHRRLRESMAIMIREYPSAAALEGLRRTLPERGEAGLAAIALAAQLRDRGSIPALEALARAPNRSALSRAADEFDTSVTPTLLTSNDPRVRAARDALKRITAF